VERGEGRGFQLNGSRQGLEVHEEKEEDVKTCGEGGMTVVPCTVEGHGCGNDGYGRRPRLGVLPHLPVRVLPLHLCSPLLRPTVCNPYFDHG